MNSIKQMIQQLNSTGFWKVLFGWRSIKRWLINSLLELQPLVDNAERQRAQLEQLDRELNQSGIILESSENRVNELMRDREILTQQNTDLRNKLKDAEILLIQERNKNDRREDEQKKSIQSLEEVKNDLSNERRKIDEDRKQEIIARFDRQRVTWQTHEEAVKNKVRSICDKHIIEYVDKPPFQGSPDNTVKICNEYVIFDAKSPAGENLDNFENYLKREAENAKKYTKHNNVSSDIFLIIPSNTLEALSPSSFQYTFDSHRVYIMPAEALEIVMLRLKKIEDYEFAEQMSPEDRENICRIIARMMYHLKRRIQVDNYLNKDAISLASDCETLLPPDFGELVDEIQRSIRLNPPQDRMGKEISLSALEKETNQIDRGLDKIDLTQLNGVVPISHNQLRPLEETGS